MAEANTLMRSNAEIVEEVVGKSYIDNALNIFRVPTTYRDDLYQEAVIVLLTMPTERLNDIADDGKLPYFIGKIVKNQYHSTTSDFYRVHRRYARTTSSTDGWDIPDDSE